MTLHILNNIRNHVENFDFIKVFDILEEVKKELKPFIEKFKKEIPIFVAGGIDNGQKIKKFMKEFNEEKLYKEQVIEEEEEIMVY